MRRLRPRPPLLNGHGEAAGVPLTSAALDPVAVGGVDLDGLLDGRSFELALRLRESFAMHSEC